MAFVALLALLVAVLDQALETLLEALTVSCLDLEMLSEGVFVFFTRISILLAETKVALAYPFATVDADYAGVGVPIKGGSSLGGVGS